MEKVVFEVVRQLRLARVFNEGRLTLHVDGCDQAVGHVTQRLDADGVFGTPARGIPQRFPHEATCACLPDHLRVTAPVEQPPAVDLSASSIAEALDEIEAAGRRRTTAQAAYDVAHDAAAACPSGKGSRKLATARRDAMSALAGAEGDVSRAHSGLESAIRRANPGATPPQIMAATGAARAARAEEK